MVLQYLSEATSRKVSRPVTVSVSNERLERLQPLGECRGVLLDAVLHRLGAMAHGTQVAHPA